MTAKNHEEATLDQIPIGPTRRSQRRRWSRRTALARFGGGGLAAGILGTRNSGSTAAQDDAESAATEAAVRQAIEAINAVLAGGDVTPLDTIIAPGYVNHTPHRSPATNASYPPNRAGLQSALTDLRGAVPDAVLVVDEIIANGGSAAVRLAFRGTAEATSADTSATTAYPLTIGGVAIVRVRGGLIAETWDYDEFAELFGGAFGVPAEAEEEPVSTTSGVRRVEIAGVNEVAVQGIGTLRLTQSDTESLTIEAEPKVLRRLSAEVADGQLTIRPARPIRTREPIVYSLTVRDLSAIELSGAVEAEAAQFSTDALDLSLSGSSALEIQNLNAENLSVTGEGNAAILLAGTTTTQTVELSGSSRYLAADLVSEEASLTVSGASQARVQATAQLTVEISGAGSVIYAGNPEITQDISGAGSLTQAR